MKFNIFIKKSSNSSWSVLETAAQLESYMIIIKNPIYLVLLQLKTQ